MSFLQKNSVSVIFTGKFKKMQYKENIYPWITSDEIQKSNDNRKHIHQHIYDELFNKKSSVFEEFCIKDNSIAKNVVTSSTNFQLKPVHYDVKKRISSIQFLVFNKRDFLLIINFDSFGADFIKETKNYWKLFFSIRQYFKFTNIKSILSTLIESDNIILNDSYGENSNFARFKIMSSIILECGNEASDLINDLNYIMSCAIDTNTFENIVSYKLNPISLYKNHYLSVSKEAICSLTVKKKNISFYKNGKNDKIYKDLKLAYYIYLLQYSYLFYFKKEVMLACDKEKVYLKVANNLSEELIYFTTNYRYTSISSFDYLDKAYTYILEENKFNELLKDIEKSVNPLFEYYNKKKKSYINILLEILGVIATTYTTHNVLKFFCKDLNSIVVIITFAVLYLLLIIIFENKKTTKFKISK